MTFDISTAVKVDPTPDPTPDPTGDFDITTAGPITPPEESGPSIWDPVANAAQSWDPADEYGSDSAAPLGDLPGDVLAVLGEFANATNRTVAETIDFIGPGTINAALRLAGVDYQLPTAGEGLSATPGGEGGFMEEGTARDMVRAAGTTTAAAGGLVPVARNAGNFRNVLMDMLGFGSSESVAASQAARMGSQVDTVPADKIDLGPGIVDEAVPEGQVPLAAPEPSPETQLKLDLIKRNPSNATATVKLEPDPSFPGATRVVPDQLGANAVEQGIPEGTVASVKAADGQTRGNMRRSLEILKKGMKNDSWAARNRPSQVVGDAVHEQYKTLKKLNREAGRELSRHAKTMKNPVDLTEPLAEFRAHLEELGVASWDQETRKLVLSPDADLREMPKAEQTLNKVLRRIEDTLTDPTGWRVHRDKQWFDDILDYDKVPGGSAMTKQLDRAVKQLRRGYNEALRNADQDYARINDQFRDTRRATDNLDSISRTIALDSPYADEALGTLLRRLLSNAVSRQPLTNAVEEIGETISKYEHLIPVGTAPHSDIHAQMMFLDTLEKNFGSFAPSSFMNDITKAVGQAAVGEQVGAARSGFNAVTGLFNKRNPENAIKALEDLLNAP